MIFRKLNRLVVLSLMTFTATFSTLTHAEENVSAPQPNSAYKADIRYTSYGVPHIKAETYQGLGFGVAYAFAKDNICLMAEQFITLRGVRSKYLGRNTFYHDMFAESLGERVYNVDSDFYHKLIFNNVAAKQKAGASKKLQQIVSGWVEGYNKYVTDNKGEMATACNNEPWVVTITEDDLYRRFLQAQMLGGFGTFMKPIADAIPGNIPKESSFWDWFTATHKEQTDLSLTAKVDKLSQSFGEYEVGSNALAFGKELTPDGRGLLFGNPHFPWSGSERLYQMHLTIEGEYDIMGSALYGVPFPMIGFNNDISWSLTWSTDIRYLIRTLKLNKENPRQYYVDGKLLKMEPITLEIEIKNDDGTLTKESRTAYKTIYGPLLGGQFFEHSTEQAYAITDFNYDNNRGTESYFQITQAKQVKDIDDNQNHFTGLPYSNVIAVDSTGKAYYSNKSIAANVSNEQIERCLTGETAKMYKDNFGIVTLDGSDSSCDPINDVAAPQPGIIAAKNKPYIFRDDYTVQTNDSHWIVNADPNSFLEGHPYVVGNEQTVRGERLRVTTDFIKKRQSNEDGLGGNKMTPEHIRQIFYNARLIEAESMKDDLVADCEANPNMRPPWSLFSVDVSEACKVLKNWNASENSESVGTHIFREFYRNMSSPAGLNPEIWLNPFDPKRPLETPNGLKPSRDTQAAFALAVKTIIENDIPLDAKLSDIQFIVRNGKKISVSGGQGFHRLSLNFKKGVGYTDPVLTGDSYIQSVSLSEEGPTGYVVNAYSQSTNPDSVHSYDQTVLYGNKKWEQIRFTDQQIESDPNYHLLHIEK
jgi:acyl-homoserine-lactone acylase